MICRFLYEDLKVDVMSTQAIGWAPSDKWYGPGFKYLQEVKIEVALVRILPLAYFVASCIKQKLSGYVTNACVC